MKPKRNRRRLAMSLRMRVAAWIACAVLLCGAFLLGVLREGVRQALLHELDANLHAEADEILLEQVELAGQQSRLHEIMELQARGHRDGSWYSQLLDDQGGILYATSTTPRLGPHASRFAAGKAESVSGYRVLEKASPQDQGSGAAVRVGTSLAVIQADMNSIDRLVAGAAISILIAAPLAGFLLATVAVRPITEMSERTAQLQPQKLDERLPIRGAGDELDRLAGVINGLLGRIAQYVGEHRGLMADAAHQLRTPLAAIRSSVEVILAAEENSEENRELMEKVIEQTESLETLVNQLLLLAETEVGNLQRATERVSLDALVQQSLEMFGAVAEELGVALEAGALARVDVQGHRHHLRQVVNNLIDNALKFTAIKEREPRRVSVDLLRDDEQRVARLRVVDTGIGIPGDQLPQVFSRFFRGDFTQRGVAVGGNGLGLPIVKSVAESHGGHVEVVSKVEEGTTFLVTLPLSTT